MQTSPYFFRRLRFDWLTSLATSSFGTLTSFFIRLENFPNPLGFLCAFAIVAILFIEKDNLLTEVIERRGTLDTARHLSRLSLQAHESRVPNGREFSVSQPLPHNAHQNEQEPPCVVQLTLVEPERL